LDEKVKYQNVAEIVAELLQLETRNTYKSFWIFSQGQLLLLHVCSRLSVQSTQALLCLGSWGKMGLVKDKDVMADVDGEEEEFEDGWDAIQK
jgi:hypothetical protein